MYPYRSDSGAPAPPESADGLAQGIAGVSLDDAYAGSVSAHSTHASAPPGPPGIVPGFYPAAPYAPVGVPSGEQPFAAPGYDYELDADYAAGSPTAPGAGPSHVPVPAAVSAPAGPAAARRRPTRPLGGAPTLPFNKAFVDEYRTRMKADPDPEAQFAYVQYLIEAARRIADPSDSQKQQRKYRDALLQEALKLVKRLATTGAPVSDKHSSGGTGGVPYAEAQFFLANCFGNGSLGLAVDHEKAYNLYVQASKQNHAAATYRTAVCSEVGAGTKRDPARAVQFYRKASALDDTAGMYKYGMILLHGWLGVPKNPREALVWLRRAADQADEETPHALHELALLYERAPVPSHPNARNAVVLRDENYARELELAAAHLGYAPAAARLGAAYEYGQLACPVDPRRSIAWYTRAAAKGHAEAEIALSGWYLTGAEGILGQSDAEAYLWARRAAQQHNPKAQYAVGYYTEVGIGVEADSVEAKKWYLRAASQNNKSAIDRLAELKRQGAAKKGSRPTRKDAESECTIM